MPKTKAAQGTSTLQSFNPATGQVMGEIPANSPQEVREAVAQARKVAPEWAALGPKDRAGHLRGVRHRMFERLEDILDTVSAENGKPRAEALAHDVLPSLATM